MYSIYRNFTKSCNTIKIENWVTKVFSKLMMGIVWQVCFEIQSKYIWESSSHSVFAGRFPWRVCTWPSSFCMVLAGDVDGCDQEFIIYIEIYIYIMNSWHYLKTMQTVNVCERRWRSCCTSHLFHRRSISACTHLQKGKPHLYDDE